MNVKCVKDLNTDFLRNDVSFSMGSSAKGIILRINLTTYSFST
jgi:hypothetical protein